MERNDKKWRIPKKIIRIVILCIVLNCIGKYISSSLRLPIWMDALGTAIAAYYTGPVGAIATGVVTNLVYGGLFEPACMLYAVTSAGVGLILGVFAKKGYYSDFPLAMIASFMAGFVSVLISTPINFITSNGMTGNRWGDALIDMLKWYGTTPIIAAYAGQAIVDIFDKQITVIFVCVYLRWSKKEGGVQRWLRAFANRS